MRREYLPLETIRTDAATQPRCAIDMDTVREYQALIEASDPTKPPILPPVHVFWDGATYWLADGFHRWHAHKGAGRETIFAEVWSGTKREAILYSVGANADHGLRRTNADKRRAVETLLMDEEWAQWSDNEIAI